MRGLYKSLQHFADPAERFDKFVYAYGQIGYLNAVIQDLISTSMGKNRCEED